MIKTNHGWKGTHRWSKDNAWKRDQWSFNKVNGIAPGVTAHGLSLIDGTAFVVFSGPSLAGYIGVEGTSTPWRINVYDPDGDLAYGFVGAAGGGVALDAESYSTADFAADADWTKGTGWAISGGVGTATTASSNITQAITPTSGKLMKHVVTITARTAGSLQFFCDNAAVTSYSMSAAATYTSYRTSTAVANYGFTAVAASLSIDNASLKQVTDCADTGAHIVSAKDGSTHNWASIGANFNYNSANYRVELRRA